MQPCGLNNAKRIKLCALDFPTIWITPNQGWERAAMLESLSSYIQGWDGGEMNWYPKNGRHEVWYVDFVEGV